MSTNQENIVSSLLAIENRIQHISDRQSELENGFYDLMSHGGESGTGNAFFGVFYANYGTNNILNQIQSAHSDQSIFTASKSGNDIKIELDLDKYNVFFSWHFHNTLGGFASGGGVGFSALYSNDFNINTNYPNETQLFQQYNITSVGSAYLASYLNKFAFDVVDGSIILNNGSIAEYCTYIVYIAPK